ncbi:MAG: methyltransferase domain-containing protein, partial [Bryobacteraceae bacterium]
GRRLDMPIGLFLCGAASVVTADLHRYLKPALALHSLQALSQQRETLRPLFLRVTDASGLDRRMESLIRATTFGEFLTAAHIEYRAPADAARMDLAGGSIDLQTSYTVFEHIPKTVLAAILRESSRLLSNNGVTCHHIDPSDHFSHEDPAISAIHFLRYSETEWDKYAGNQFAYHNRLRTHQYRQLYEECGHTLLQWKEIVDSRSLAEIRSGFPLHPEFQHVAAEILSTAVVRAISRPLT